MKYQPRVPYKFLYFLQYKMWLKPSAEQQFVYGHHVMKSGLGRITENTPQYQGLIVYSMNDLPLVIITWYFTEGRITENTPQYQGIIVYSINNLPLVCIVLKNLSQIINQVKAAWILKTTKLNQILKIMKIHRTRY